MWAAKHCWSIRVAFWLSVNWHYIILCVLKFHVLYLYIVVWISFSLSFPYTDARDLYFTDSTLFVHSVQNETKRTKLRRVSCGIFFMEERSMVDKFTLWTPTFAFTTFLKDTKMYCCLQSQSNIWSATWVSSSRFGFRGMTNGGWQSNSLNNSDGARQTNSIQSIERGESSSGPYKMK